MEIRSFLAFELPLDIKEIVARVSSEIRKSPLNVRCVHVDNIHLTVIFMGNIKTGDIVNIGTEVEKVCFRYSPFDISLREMGFFPNKRNPRVLWLGLDGDLERMSHFRDSLQKQLGPFGIKEEKRRFTPHLTLGRFRNSHKGKSHLNEFIMRYRDLTSPVCPLTELILFQSTLKPSGAEYTKLGSWPLSGDE
jgi:2'-5' RNA ligase